MSIQTIPAGYRGPHVLADYLLTRRCGRCGERTERYFDGGLLRAERVAAWGPRSLNRMARELGMPASSLSAKERGLADFTEDEARAYLSALGLI